MRAQAGHRRTLRHQIKDLEGYRRVASRSAALGFDGKWVLHHYTSEAGGARGAVMLGDEMIDEASRKMALVISAKGRAAGMSRTNIWTAPEG